MMMSALGPHTWARASLHTHPFCLSFPHAKFPMILAKLRKINTGEALGKMFSFNNLNFKQSVNVRGKQNKSLWHRICLWGAKEKQKVPFLMDVVKGRIEFNFGPHCQGCGQKTGGCLSAQAGKHLPHCAQSQAHLLICMETVSTRELWKGVDSLTGNQSVHAPCFCRALLSQPSIPCLLFHSTSASQNGGIDPGNWQWLRYPPKEVCRSNLKKKEKSASSSF